MGKRCEKKKIFFSFISTSTFFYFILEYFYVKLFSFSNNICAISSSICLSLGFD